MFTGLIEAIGSVRAMARNSRGARVEIGCPFTKDLSRGDSVAVDGACLTVVEMRPASFFADVSNETIQRTTLGDRNPGDPVNLERALAVGQRLGGHYVLGHVDVVGTVKRVTGLGDAIRFDVSYPPELAPLLVDKGSIAIDGISLTINGVDDGSFWVALIPESQERTTLASKRPGDRVNLEADVLGKYVLRALATSKRVEGIDEALLARAGFIPPTR